MNRSDADKWNKRYRSAGHNLSKPRDFLMEHRASLPQKGWALDVAMGLGHNAGVLLDQGLQVVGVELSTVALRKARRTFTGLHAIQVDLPELCFRKDTFNVLLNFWFLDRSLFPIYMNILKPGGLLFFETMREDDTMESQADNPAFLLKQGELAAAFQDWEFLVYDENVTATVHGKPQMAVRMLARKPQAGKKF